MILASWIFFHGLLKVRTTELKSPMYLTDYNAWSEDAPPLQRVRFEDGMGGGNDGGPHPSRCPPRNASRARARENRRADDIGTGEDPEEEYVEQTTR